MGQRGRCCEGGAGGYCGKRHTKIVLKATPDICEEVPSGVRPVGIHHPERVHDIFERFGHLLSFYSPVRMGEKLLRKWKIKGHQHRGEVQRVEPDSLVRRPKLGEGPDDSPNDILPHNLQIRRPSGSGAVCCGGGGISDGSEVVY